MAVSYLSRTTKSSPYVAPIDLNLFEKVLTVKQGQFNQGAAKTQAAVDQMGSLDVMKDADREYLNGKIGSIVDSINGMGGVDFSDMSTLNQIEGMGSEVYGDKNVISAISSTRSARNLMSSYEKMKSDPKLSKLYSEVNESYDMRRVNDWLSDGKVGSAYQGPSSATAYTDYRTNHMKLFEKMKANMKTTITDQGLFYINEKNEYLTPEQVMQAASDLMTPQERSQMKRDAWYLYNVQAPVAPQQLIGKSLEHFENKIATSQSLQKEYEGMAKAAAADPAARQRYNMLAEQQARTTRDLQSGAKSAQQNAIQQYQEDPEEFMYQVYNQDYMRGLGNRFSVSRTDRSIQADQGEMFELKYKQENYQFREQMKRQDAKIALEAERNQISWLATGLKMLDKNGKAVPVNPGGLTSSNLNTQDPEGLIVNEKTILEANESLAAQTFSLEQDFLNQFFGEHPELIDESQTASEFGTGVNRVMKGQELLEDVNGIKGFQMDDLSGLQWHKYQDKLKGAGVTPAQIQTLSKMYQNFTALAEGTGEPIDVPEGLAKLVEDRTMNMERINANNLKLRQAKARVGETLGLDAQDIAILEDARANPAKYERNIYNVRGDWVGKEEVPALQAVTKKLNGKSYGRELDKYLAPLATRDVFNTKTFSDSDPLLKDGHLQRWIATELNTRHNGANYEVNGIQPLTAGMAADGKGGFYVQAQVTTGSGEKKKVETIQLTMTDENAKKFGLHRDPYENLNYSVRAQGHSGDIPVYSGNKNLAITVRIMQKKTTDLNDVSSYAQAIYYYKDENGQKTGRKESVKIPATDGMTPSEAYALAKRAIEEAGSKKITFDQFKDYLYNYKNQ